jgi:putative heme iron utilization protein
LLVEDATQRRNPQTGPRVSLLGTIKKDTSPDVRARFLARHPDAALYADFGDFAFYRMKVERAHYVGGFARAIWFDAKQILSPASAAKIICDMEHGIVEHMNHDHVDAIRAYAHAFAKRRPGPWQMTGCDTDGIDLRADGRYARVDFHKPVTDSNTCRKMLIEMAHAARA